MKIDLRELQKFKGIDPDFVKHYDGNAIIFVDGKLLYDPQPGRAHVSFFNQGETKGAQWLRKRLASEIGKYPAKPFVGSPSNWFKLYDKYLFGRVGFLAAENLERFFIRPDLCPDGAKIASFWGRGAQYDNPNAKGPTELIPACVQAMYYKELIDDDTVVVWGDGRVALVGAMLAGGSAGSDPVGTAGVVDPEIVQQMELRKRLHLATGAEKQQIMQKLGVRGGEERPIVKGLKQVGLLGPGQKYWAMQSESFQNRLNEVLEQL